MMEMQLQEAGGDRVDLERQLSSRRSSSCQVCALGSTAVTGGGHMKLFALVLRHVHGWCCMASLVALWAFRALLPWCQVV